MMTTTHEENSGIGIIPDNLYYFKMGGLNGVYLSGTTGGSIVASNKADQWAFKHVDAADPAKGYYVFNYTINQYAFTVDNKLTMGTGTGAGVAITRYVQDATQTKCYITPLDNTNNYAWTVNKATNIVGLDTIDEWSDAQTITGVTGSAIDD